MEVIVIQQNGQQEQKQKCPVCGELGIVHPLEFLPKDGISKKCIHENGVDHIWAEYSSFNKMFEKNKKRSNKPRIFVCPVCNKRGRLNEYSRNQLRPERIQYRIYHEKIEGSWGKNQTSRKRRICYITKQEHRDIILKKLGRFIQK